MAAFIPVILAGGAGARLWPASRSGLRKPFLTLIGADPMIVETASRLTSLSGVAGKPLVICGRGDLAAARSTLDDRFEPDFLVEPFARGTAAAVAAAALFVSARHGPDTRLIICPSDHAVGDLAAFRSALSTALDGPSGLGLIGARPNEPSSAYGYVMRGAAAQDERAAPVTGFREKPDPEIAADLIARGALWNVGIFIGAAGRFVRELSAHAPKTLSAVSASLRIVGAPDAECVLSEAYGDAPDQPFDRAVMEKTQSAFVVPAEMAWSDVGDWDAVARSRATDAADDVIRSRGDGTPPVRRTRVRRCYVDVDGTGAVRLTDVADLVLIRRGEAALVCHRAHAQTVREAAAHFDDGRGGIFERDCGNTAVHDAAGGPLALIGLRSVRVERAPDGTMTVAGLAARTP